MIRLNINEINDLITEDYNINIYNNKLLNEMKSLFDDEYYTLFTESINLPSIKSKPDPDKITSLTQLENRINEIMDNEPQGVIKAIKVYKILSMGLQMLGSIAASSYVLSTDGHFEFSFKRMLLSCIGGMIAGNLIAMLNNKFLDKIASNIIRKLSAPECRLADQEKIRLFNELIKSINKNANRTKSTIEREALQNSMYKAIELRDQISSRLHFLNKGAKPIENNNENKDNF